jgi:predicted RecB family nuclease
MQDLDGVTVYSATDLVGFLACEHLTTLDRVALTGALSAEDRVDEELEVLRTRGEEHELRYLSHLQSQGRVVVEGRHPKGHAPWLTKKARLEADAELTRRLMHEGADVIYQATLFDGSWRGYADFLLRTDGPSNLGDHHYEVADTKLARKTKGGALLQMCVYSDLVAKLQGRMPAEMHVALGGSGRNVASHRLDDYLAYYRSVKARFLAATSPDQTPTFPLPVVPEPVSHCEVCRWQPYCAGLRREADHLSLVASMRSDQARRLRGAGIGTLTDLATLPAPLPDVEDLGAATLAALHQQARLQHASRGRKVPEIEFLPVEPNRGLTALPPPSGGDLFFDIEGDPFAEEDGLEYLFGVWDPAAPDDAGRFRSWWAHTRAEEKVAFEAFVDFVMARWQAVPEMHVYHYAAYERGRMGMLSTRHATREAQVDRMLTAELFVDLFKVVRQGMRIGLESYSIKKLEPLYALDREADLKEAGSSIVAYERYIRSASSGKPDTAILHGIELYNQDDCRSNAELRDWLEAQRRVLAAQLAVTELDRSTPSADIDRPPNPRDARIAALARTLLEGVPADASLRRGDAEGQGRWLLAHLLEWHRREEKVEWWAFFDRCSRSDDDLASNDEESIGQLTWLREVDRPKQSVVHRYRFDPEQAYRLKEGDQPVNPATRRTAGTIVALDALAGTLDLSWARRSERPHPRSLIPGFPLTADPQKAALEQLGEWVTENGLASPGPWRAARDFLTGQPPRAGQTAGEPVLPAAPTVREAAREVVLRLDECVLPVQGPPGSGKTYIGAEMILSLIAAGRNVGIVAFTHRALTNLLDEVLDHAAEQGIHVAAIRKLEQGEKAAEGWRYASATDNAVVADAIREHGIQVAAGTAWMWARPEFLASVDTLFVDEAGQMSMANVLAVSGAARNLVLLGDPQQLSQVKKGAHPEGVDLSALEHVLRGAPVIENHRGVFLPETYRLHPDVNAFTSEVFYARKLESAEEAARQDLLAPGALTGTGVRWKPVVHSGNRNSSPEEAEAVVRLYRDLLAGQWTDGRGRSDRLSTDQILVVAPYNGQVELLAERLQPVVDAVGSGELRIGTVDKIQGQQAVAVIYAMATSSQDEMPRTMEFLYSLNRLNVATSRGRCLAALVCSPDLLKVRVHTPVQMRLANALCRFVEIAEEQALTLRLDPLPLG